MNLYRVKVVYTPRGRPKSTCVGFKPDEDINVVAEDMAVVVAAYPGAESIKYKGEAVII